jgi:hypothetical protein
MNEGNYDDNNYEDDFEDDFEPYETSNEDNENNKKTISRAESKTSI